MAPFQFYDILLHVFGESDCASGLIKAKVNVDITGPDNAKRFQLPDPVIVNCDPRVLARIEGLHQKIRAAQRGAAAVPLTPEDLDRLGSALNDILFDESLSHDLMTKIWEYVAESQRTASGGSETLLRYKLFFGRNTALNPLYALPWEFMTLYDRKEGQFVRNQRISIDKNCVVQRLIPNGAMKPVAPEEALRIALFVAVPAWDMAEQTELFRVPWENLYADLLEIAKLPAPPKPIIKLFDKGTPAELQAALDWKPHILHIKCHARYMPADDQREARVELALQREAVPEYATWIDARDFGKILQERVPDGPKLLFMQACESAACPPDVTHGLAEQVISAGVPSLVAMQYEVSSEISDTFAGAFYRSLCQSYAPVDKAVQDGRIAIWKNYIQRKEQNPEQADFATPVFFTRQDNPILVVPPKPVANALAQPAPNRRTARFQVYISYKHKPSSVQAVSDLAERLKTLGCAVSVDVSADGPKEAWNQGSYDQIFKSDVLLVVLSQAAINSDWVRREVDAARGAHVSVLALHLAGEQEKAVTDITRALDIEANVLKNFVGTDADYDQLIAKISTLAKETKDTQKKWLDLIDKLTRNATLLGGWRWIYQRPETPYHIVLTTGTMTALEAVDVIVNPENDYMQMDRILGDSISATIRRRGALVDPMARLLKDTVQDELGRREEGDCRRPIPLTRVLCTSAGHPESFLAKQGIRYIVHAAVLHLEQDELRPIVGRQVSDAVINCLAGAQTLPNVQSIAFPLFGSGLGRSPLDETASAMLNGLEQYFHTTNSTLKTVYWCVQKVAELATVSRLLVEKKYDTEPDEIAKLQALSASNSVQVYLTCCESHQAAADTLAAALRQTGFTVSGARDAVDDPYDCLYTSDVLIVLLGAGTEKDPLVRREVEMARGAHISILPLKVDQIEFPYERLGFWNADVRCVLGINDLDKIRYQIDRLAWRTRDAQTSWSSELKRRWRVQPADSNQRLARYRTEQAPKFTVCLAAGDIAELSGVDVLVNSENDYMQMAPSYDRSTASASLRYQGSHIVAGWIIEDTLQDLLNTELQRQEQVKQIVGRPLMLGQVVVTPAGHPDSALVKQGVRYIFHAVAVQTVYGDQGIEFRGLDSETQIADLVRRCFQKVQEINQQQNGAERPIDSIALPVFGTGHGGVPFEKVLPWLVNAVRKYLVASADRPDMPSTIYLCVYGESQIDTAQGVMKQVFSEVTR